MTCHECIHKYCCKYDRFFGVDAVEDKCFYFKNKADFVEVKHGEWILEREPDGTPYIFHCSVCDSDFSHIGHKSATDYCPDCGAKMDGGKVE